MEKTITELKEKRDWYINELEELHIHEPSEEYYMLRRSDLEFQIASLEEILDELETQAKFKRNRVTRFLATVVLIAIISSFIYMIFI